MGIKMAGAVCVLISCSAMGFLQSAQIRARYRELLELKKILYQLEGYIRFSSCTLEEAFESVAGRCEAPYDGFFSGLAEEMGEKSGVTLAELWQKAMEDKLSSSRLAGEERELLERMGRDLGRLDRETQLKALSLSGGQLEEARQRLLQELPGKMKLYNCLGILAGVFLTILLV